MQCIGIKTSGIRCTAICLGDHTRCGTHQRTITLYGPNTTRRREIRYVFLKNILEIQEAYFNNQDMPRAQLNQMKRVEKLRYDTELNNLENLILIETEQNGGIDADLEANNRRRERMQIARQRIAAARQRWLEARQRFAVEIPPQVRQPGELLAVLANDRQNVHTTVVVNKVKETVEKILLIPVPVEYRTETYKTLYEIIPECKLDPLTIIQTTRMYYEGGSIYDLGEGIYPKVLNAVWQYIKNSEHKDDLQVILRSELRDNVFTCAQGNLSRLCNVLAGYLDGMTTESTIEELGRRLAELDGDEVDRLNAGTAILRELKIPEIEWENWLEPLRD